MQRNFICLGQDGLERIVRRKLGEYGYGVEYGTELVSLEQLDNRVNVTLHVSKGGRRVDSTRVEDTYEYVMGADGAGGAVRKQLGLQFLGDNLEIGMAIGDIKVEGLPREAFLWPLTLLVAEHAQRRLFV